MNSYLEVKEGIGWSAVLMGVEQGKVDKQYFFELRFGNYGKI